ncbi:MAG: Fur family transcriptional regulator [Actinomycetaceae bacterium]|nr:Fur family transcriptional regulator [Actinomycetaceae bacterium]
MVPDYAQILRSHKMRVTAARIAVLSTTHDFPHCDADEIRSHVEQRLGTISGQAVYDALNSLTDAGILRRVEPAGVRARYEFDKGDNHHHIVCRLCGYMDDIDCQTGHAPCMTIDNDHGWHVDEAEVYFWGRCPQCLQTEQRHSA